MDSPANPDQLTPTLGRWQQLSAPGQADEFAWAWLSLLCEQIPGVVSGLLLEVDENVKESNDGELVPRAVWPQPGQDVEQLSPVIGQAQQTSDGVLLALESGETNHYGLAYPLSFEQKLIAIVGIELVAESERQLQHAMQQLQWGMSWLEAAYFKTRFQAQGHVLEGLRAGHTLLAAILSEPHFDAACMRFTAELATQLDCDRVSVGFLQRGHVRVQALSHSVEPGRKMSLVRAIAGAMEESVDQHAPMVFPPLSVQTVEPEPGPLIFLAHQNLSRDNRAESVLTLPLDYAGQCMGAVTLERPAETPFTADELAFCRNVSVLAAAVFHDKQLNDQSVWQKLSSRGHQFLLGLLGAGYLKRKLLLAGAIFLGLYLSLVTTELRIAADSVLRGEVQRSIVAPFSGYLQQSQVRPGDVVQKGDEFARLDDHDLRLERVKWASQREQFKRQYEEAMATRNRVQARILMAQIAQADARLALTESRLQRTRIIAPFDGIVVRGDLSQRLGASLQEGEVLFELAPLNAYRVVLSVDERDIALIRRQQQGYLIASALPGDKFAFTVTRITPISVPAEGKNTFQVEARLQKNDSRLRPGMEGVGKIDTGEQTLIHIWTRRLVHWLRLQWWAWFG